MTDGQGLVWDQLVDHVRRHLSARVPRTFDELIAHATAAAARSNTDAPSREQLALELVLLLEHGIARLAPLRKE